MALFEFLKLAFPAQRRYSETRCPAYGFRSSVLHFSCVNFCTESLIFIPHKIYVLPKVVRAKLPGPWEGGGCGGKKHPPNYIIWCFFFFLGFVRLSQVALAEPDMWLSCSLPATVGIAHFFCLSLSLYGGLSFMIQGADDTLHILCDKEGKSQPASENGDPSEIGQ